jgi:hypothetical protein
VKWKVAPLSSSARAQMRPPRRWTIRWTVARPMPREIAEADGGRVDLKSAPGAGSTCVVRLPRS